MPNVIDFREGTDAVLTTATQLDGLGDEFARIYTSLYTLIESDLAQNWKGEDADAFRNVAENQRPVFESMRDVIGEYATFLRQTANAHEARMQDSRSASNQVTF